MTPAQAKVLNFVRRYMAEHGGVSPTYGEIAAGIGRRSKGSVVPLVTALERQGAIKRVPASARSIVLLGRTTGVQPGADASDLESRALSLLVDVLDNPLITLPGNPHCLLSATGEELRLAHFRPDLSEKIAGLLEEAGR